MIPSFLKMSAAGNDFLVFDDREGGLTDVGPERWARLCARRTGIGADGVLLLRPSRAGEFRMVYLNADGREAEMCGNGARCIAWAAAVEWGMGEPMDPETPRPDGWGLPEGFGSRQIWAVTFEAADGVHHAVGWDRTVLVTLGDPSEPRPLRLDVGDTVWEGSLLTVGVPHLVIPVSDPDAVAVPVVGPSLRAHPAVGPAGANVDFVASAPDHEGCYAIRTYERGVEAETLACGTGTASAAILLAASGALSPVSLKTRSGASLQIHFTRDAGRIRSLWLEGPVLVAYRGTLADI